MTETRQKRPEGKEPLPSAKDMETLRAQLGEAPDSQQKLRMADKAYREFHPNLRNKVEDIRKTLMQDALRDAIMNRDEKTERVLSQRILRQYDGRETVARIYLTSGRHGMALKHYRESSLDTRERGAREFLKADNPYYASLLMDHPNLWKKGIDMFLELKRPDLAPYAIDLHDAAIKHEPSKETKDRLVYWFAMKLHREGFKQAAKNLGRRLTPTGEPHPDLPGMSNQEAIALLEELRRRARKK